MSLQEILESERAGLAALRSIRQRHPNDVETLRLVVEAQDEAAGRILSLTELYHYRDEANNGHNNNGNGGE